MSPKTHLVTNLFANLDKADFRKFKVKFHLWLGLILSTHSGQSLADLVLISPYEPVSIAIDKTTGSLIQLPGSVKTITPSTQFEITDVASEVDEVSGMKSNVRLLQVRPLPGAKSETVTFVLGNGKSIKSVLMVAEGAQKHYELVYPPETKKLKKPQVFTIGDGSYGCYDSWGFFRLCHANERQKNPLKRFGGFFRQAPTPVGGFGAHRDGVRNSKHLIRSPEFRHHPSQTHGSSKRPVFFGDVCGSFVSCGAIVFRALWSFV